MKRFKSLLALLLAALILSASLSGCGSNKEEPLVTQITGSKADDTVLTINGTGISAELYYYWLSIVCEDTAAYYTDGIPWDEQMYEGVTVSDYIQNTTVDTLVQYQIVTDLDKEYQLLDEEEIQTYLDGVVAENIEGFGSEEAFEESLAAAGVSRETLLYLYETQYLYSDLQDKLFAAGGPLEVPDSEIQLFIDQNYGAENGSYSAKHILIKTVDDFSEPLPEEELTSQKAKAEDILSQLRASEDPTALFDELMAEHNEDPGEPEEGYTFGPGEMVDAFYEGTAALEEYEISDLVESPFGYHIILRLPSVIPTVDELRESYLLEQFSILFQERVISAVVEFNESVSLMSPKEYYTEYVKTE